MAKNIEPKQVITFVKNDDSEPFGNWLNSLRDVKGKLQIVRRLRKLEQGHYGDCKSVGGGVFELRIFFGPGYRVYFGEDGDNVVILLCGGDKSSQKSDIKTAKQYWQEYKDHG